MIKAQLKTDLRGGLPDFIKPTDGVNRYAMGKMYFLPEDYDFSNNYFEIIETEHKESKEDGRRNRNKDKVRA